MSSSTTKTTFNNSQLNRQTFRILNTNSLHFIPISLLFLPFTFSACIVVQFYVSSSTFSPNIDVTTFFEPFNLHIIKYIIANSQNLLTLKSLSTILAFIIFVVLPTTAGIVLITYSTDQAIHHRHLNFSSSFKSLIRSYIHLLSTIIAGSIQLIIISLLLTLFPVAITHAIKALGFHFDLYIISIITNTFASYGLVLTLIFYMVNWGSAASIAVLESKSGFKPLTQSADQLIDFRSHSLSIVFVTGFVCGSSLFSYRTMSQNIESKTYWILILQVCAMYLQSSLMILYYVVANTVLYVKCKVANGEEPEKMTVGGEVSGEYVRVDVNEKDDEVSNELAKEDVNGGFNYLMYLLCIVWQLLLLSMLFKIILFWQ